MTRRRPESDPIKFDNFPEINKLIARFLQDVAKDFSDFSDINAVNEPIIYGFNVRIGSNGAPVIGSFGNIKPTEPKVGYGEDREPLVDVLEKGKEVTIIAEMPGVNKETVKVTAHPTEVTIEARDHGRSYNKKIRVSGNINTKAKSAKFHNGVLELVFLKSQIVGKTSAVKVT